MSRRKYASADVTITEAPPVCRVETNRTITLTFPKAQWAFSSYVDFNKYLTSGEARIVARELLQAADELDKAEWA